ncbi:MAG: hypothetical protein NVS3B3_09410 [Aquirhabdus sp.]
MKFKTGQRSTFKLIVTSSLFAMTLSGCTAVDNGLNAVSNGLTQVNRVLGAPTAVAKTGNTASTNPITAAQTDKIVNGLVSSRKQYNNNLGQAIGEAAPNIGKVISFLSCYNNPSSFPDSYLGQYIAPKGPFDGYNSQLRIAPISRMQYHPKSQCLTVVRFQGWSMLAANAIKFQVLYISDSSGETQTDGFVMVKQPFGEWLFN